MVHKSAAAVVWAKEKGLTPLVVSISINNNDAVKQMSIAAQVKRNTLVSPP